LSFYLFFFFFQAEDGIRDRNVTGVQTCALPICRRFQTFFVNYLLVNTFELQEYVVKIDLFFRLWEGCVQSESVQVAYRHLKEQLIYFVLTFFQIPVVFLPDRFPKRFLMM